MGYLRYIGHSFFESMLPLLFTKRTKRYSDTLTLNLGSGEAKKKTKKTIVRRTGRNRRLGQSLPLVALLHLAPYDLDHQSYGLALRSIRRHWTPKTLPKAPFLDPQLLQEAQCVAALWQRNQATFP
jgi:hypothetical protein